MFYFTYSVSAVLHSYRIINVYNKNYTYNQKCFQEGRENVGIEVSNDK